MSIDNPHRLSEKLLNKSVDYAVFRFFFGESQRHQLHELLAGNLAYRGLVNERRVGGIGADLRHRADRSGVHDDRVTFGVPRTFVVAVDVGDIQLFAVFSGNRTRNDMGTRPQVIA